MNRFDGPRPRRGVTLEMSLKPFFSVDEETIRAVCRRMFIQWKPLADVSETVSVLLWSADGSEILEYDGNPDTRFEWAYFIGGANRCTDWDRQADPDGRGLHTVCYPYRERPPVMTYGILGRIIRLLREEGNAVLEKPVRIGATFDPGPEFALSDFKYRRHREICAGESMGRKSMVCCYARLHAEQRPYAGFPEGIPEGLPFGTFFGRQAQLFLQDLAEGDFERIYQRVKEERTSAEQKLASLMREAQTPVDRKALAKTLAERFLSSADQNRELLVSLVERVEFSEDKQLYIHFRFPSLEAIL